MKNLDPQPGDTITTGRELRIVTKSGNAIEYDRFEVSTTFEKVDGKDLFINGQIWHFREPRICCLRMWRHYRMQRET